MATTGVQILFAFLLGLAFTQRFGEADEWGVAVHTVILLASALATVLLIARCPSTGWCSGGGRRAP